MAKEVISYTWCDICLDRDDARVEAEEVTIQLAALKPRVLALCEVHTKEIITPLREILQELGQVDTTATVATTRTPSANRQAGQFFCPEPSCGKMYHYKQSLRNHCRENHGTTLNELLKVHGESQRGGDTTLPGTDPSAAEEFACDQPGCNVAYDPAEYAKPAQALGLHRKKVHGLSGKAK